MWQLGLASGGGSESYPERPDEPDCIYYLRTGFCGYGSRCRFNHPTDRSASVYFSNHLYIFMFLPVSNGSVLVYGILVLKDRVVLVNVNLFLRTGSLFFIVLVYV